MKHWQKNGIVLAGFLFLFAANLSYAGDSEQISRQDEVISALHKISSHKLQADVIELCRKKYGGRLSGTSGYEEAARWVAVKLAKWGIKPAGDRGTFFQNFSNPYTLVLDAGKLLLHLPVSNGKHIEKKYVYEKDYLPGSTSSSGEITAEVIYVGYGITAPELNFDEYAGLDVRNKIVLIEREVPVSADDQPDRFKQWRPYSFHQYKVKNAKAHGAAGMLYIYHLANPNCLYQNNFILTYIAHSVVKDLFTGTGKIHEKVKETISESLKPQSFSTGKKVTVANRTEHHPEGMTSNIIGLIPGSDPKQKNEVLVLGAHLDHLGWNHQLMPGANDNASGVAVVLAVAEQIAYLSFKPRRSLLFVFFGAEEQGVKGSEYFIKNPPVPELQLSAFLNFDSVGRGEKISAMAAENYPALWHFIRQANKTYVHRPVKPSYFHNRARPRFDAAHFMWAKIPTISFGTFGAEKLPYAIYHKTTDTPKIITPEIMEDLARIVFAATVEISNVRRLKL